MAKSGVIRAARKISLICQLHRLILNRLANGQTLGMPLLNWSSSVRRTLRLNIEAVDRLPGGHK